MKSNKDIKHNKLSKSDMGKVKILLAANIIVSVILVWELVYYI